MAVRVEVSTDTVSPACAGYLKAAMPPAPFFLIGRGEGLKGSATAERRNGLIERQLAPSSTCPRVLEHYSTGCIPILLIGQRYSTELLSER
jgi:hypothetical protein